MIRRASRARARSPDGARCGHWRCAEAGSLRSGRQWARHGSWRSWRCRPPDRRSRSAVLSDEAQLGTEADASHTPVTTATTPTPTRKPRRRETAVFGRSFLEPCAWPLTTFHPILGRTPPPFFRAVPRNSTRAKIVPAARRRLLGLRRRWLRRGARAAGAAAVPTCTGHEATSNRYCADSTGRTAGACIPSLSWNSGCSHTAASRSGAIRVAAACGPPVARSRPRAGDSMKRAAVHSQRPRSSRAPVATGGA